MNIKPLLGVVMFITSRYLAGAIEAEAKNRPLPFPSSPKFNISCISLPPESSMKAIIREDFVYYDFMRYKTTNESEKPEIKITGFSSSCDTFFCSLFAIFTEERNLPTSKPLQNCRQKRGILAHSCKGSEGSKKLKQMQKNTWVNSGSN